MGLYDNTWPSTYEEIKRLYPVWYWDVLEMDAIWRAQGIQLDGVRASIEQMIKNGSIFTADSQTISLYEKFLGITTDLSRPLEERQKVVAAMMYSTTHIGASELKEIVGFFTTAETDVTFIDGVMDLSVGLTPDNSLDVIGCFKALQRQLPAHLAWIFDVTYDTTSAGAVSVGACSELAGHMDIWPLVPREIEITGGIRFGACTTVGHSAKVFPMAARHISTTGGAAHSGALVCQGSIEIFPMEE